MTRKIIIFLMVGTIIFISGWLLYPDILSKILPTEKTVIPRKNIQEAESKVNLAIDNGEDPPINFDIVFQGTTTAFDLLKNKTKEVNIFLKSKNSDFGVFIEAIGEKDNGQSGKYWLYYVNGELPMIAADKFVIKSGDKVEFKFEKPSF